MKKKIVDWLKKRLARCQYSLAEPMEKGVFVWRFCHPVFSVILMLMVICLLLYLLWLLIFYKTLPNPALHVTFFWLLLSFFVFEFFFFASLPWIGVSDRWLITAKGRVWWLLFKGVAKLGFSLIVCYHAQPAWVKLLFLSTILVSSVKDAVRAAEDESMVSEPIGWARKPEDKKGA